MTDPQPEPQPQPTFTNAAEQPLGAGFIPFGPVRTNVHPTAVAGDGSAHVPITVEIPGVSFSFALDVETARKFAANITRQAIGSNGGLTIARALPPEPPHR